MEKFTHDDWITNFAGDKWAPLGFSGWITLYTMRPFPGVLDYFVNQNLITWDGVSTTCYIRASERADFGKRVVEQVIEDSNYVDNLANELKVSTDKILDVYRRDREGFTFEEIDEYSRIMIHEYYPCHLQVKNVVDFMPENLLEQYLPKLEKARVHAEPVFSEEVGFTERLAVFLSSLSGYSPENLLHCFVNEMTNFWRDGKELPDESVLSARKEGSIIFFESGKIAEVWVGDDIKKFGSLFAGNESVTGSIRGQTAYTGKAKGAVRLVFDPSVEVEFNEGDILVAPWTRPEYLPLMRKAGAFVTDGGGILSHAAIVARELEKPCVIATNNATQILKEGDIVEVDAEAGLITIVQKA